MKIVTVTFRRMKALSGFENETIEATAKVEENETPEQALDAIKNWVYDELNIP